MASKCFPLVRGRVMRATRLDSCGRIADRACSAITTTGFVSVALTANIDEGEEIAVVNAGGDTCVRDAAVPSFTGYGVAITFCDVNPELYAMLTNQQVVFDNVGDAVGFRVNSKVKTSDANFALEVWSNVPGVVCDDPDAAGSYGYTLLPFVSGGVLGDFTIENGAVTFTLQNAATRDGAGWGTGPYDVAATGTYVSEVQSLAITGAPTGGSYTLTYDGQTTASIAYNATNSAIQTALLALSNLDTGDVTVTGTTPTFTITFGGTLAGQNVPQITATSALTGGTTPTVNMTTTTQGSSPAAGPLLAAIDSTDHLHVQLTTIAPPDPSCDCVASGPAPTGATAGSPGSFTPTGAYPPADFTALSTGSITASPSSAWTTGQYVILGDFSHAHWNGTAWVVGDA